MLCSLILALAPSCPSTMVQAIPVKVLEVEAMPDGSILAVDSGTPVSGKNGSPGLVFSFRPDFTLTHSWVIPGKYPHSVDPMDDGRILVTDTDTHRIVALDPDGSISWDSDFVSPLSDGSTLLHPNDAEILPNGNILICERDNYRVIEIDWDGNILWQYGTLGVPGSGPNLLSNPHNSDRLANGNTLIADSLNNRILEVDLAGNIVWDFSMPGDPMNYPRDADELPDGTVLITDSKGGRIIHVEKPGTVLGIISFPHKLYEADLLPNGNYLVSGGAIYEVEPDGTIVWTYASELGPLPTSVVEERWIRNPSSGIDLFVHVHLPEGASTQDPSPVVVRVPDRLEDGDGFHDECDAWAELGFIAVHFDPDGRGLSTNGGTYLLEDYGGQVHQDGLREILGEIVAMPESDASRMALITDGYGVTMAAGCLARHPRNPEVQILIDWEGQASRDESALVNGGFIPESASNHGFWAEREAITFLPSIEACYLRFQTESDPVGLPTHDHAMDLLNAALPAAYGGSGAAPLTRVNRVLDGPSNQSYSPTAPATWLPEELDLPLFRKFMVHNALQRLFETAVCSLAGTPAPGNVIQIEVQAAPVDAGATFRTAVSGGPGPLALQDGGWVNLDLDPVLRATSSVGVLDASAHGTVEYTIPPNASLSGTVFFAQAVVERPGEPIPHIVSRPLSILVL